MRVGIIQSNYIPWRGYFDFIASVDLFIFHDDIQYTKGDWRNRNRIKTPRGLQWLSVPVHYERTAQLIEETRLDEGSGWRKDHVNRFDANYRGAAYWRDASSLLRVVLEDSDQTISDLNVRLIKTICAYLGLRTELRMSSEIGAVGVKTQRLIDMLTRVGANAYLSGPAARAYIDEDQFRAAGIRLEYKSYVYEEYPQLWGPFEGAVTVLDLIANCGRHATRYLRSRTPNEVAVP